MTAYQITSMMEGVVTRGTAAPARAQAVRSPARPAPPTTRRTPGSSAIRRTSSSASISGFDKPQPDGPRARPAAASPRRSSGNSCSDALEGQPTVDFQRAGGHEADRHQPQDRHAAPAKARPAPSSRPSSRAPGPADSYSGDRQMRRVGTAAMPRSSPQASRRSKPGAAGCTERFGLWAWRRAPPILLSAADRQSL